VYHHYTGIPAARAEQDAERLAGGLMEGPVSRREATRGLGLREAHAADMGEGAVLAHERQEMERRYQRDAFLRDYIQEVGLERAAAEFGQDMTPEATRAFLRVYGEAPEEEIWRLAPDER
jgi:hypothetical protein